MPSNALPPLPSNGLTLLDLFCGAGIGAVGFQRAGYDIVQAIDNQPHAVDTYRANVGDHVVLGDIASLPVDFYTRADVVTGGFPCTDFSVAGKGDGSTGKVGMLGSYFVNVVRHQQPQAFLLENVAGMVTKKHKPFFDSLIAELEQDYVVTHALLDFWEFGVPQRRKRVIAVGVHKRLGKTFTFPERVPLGERTTIRDAIGDLSEPNGINNHYGFGLRKDEAPLVDKVPIGGNWRSLPVDDQRAFMKGAFAAGGGRTGYLRKVSMDKPAHTLTSAMMGKFNAQLLDLSDKYGTGYYAQALRHQSQFLDTPAIAAASVHAPVRRFTVRECLRLQTVPDSFHFADTLSLSKQYERVSGIPSLIAYSFGQRLAALLNQP